MITQQSRHHLTLTLIVCCLLLTVSPNNSQVEFDSNEYGYDLNDQEELLLEDHQSLNMTGQTQIESEKMKSHTMTPALSGFIMNNLHTPYMVTTDMYRWTKTTYNGWSSILSAQPLKKGYISEVTVLIVNNVRFLIGCAQRNDDVLYNHYIGQWRNSVGYGATGGYIHIYRGYSQALQGCNVGDEITIRVDLTEGRGTVQFLKNERSLGLSYGGIFDWDNVHFGMSLHSAGSVVRIVDYKVYKN